MSLALGHAALDVCLQNGGNKLLPFKPPHWWCFVTRATGDCTRWAQGALLSGPAAHPSGLDSRHPGVGALVGGAVWGPDSAHVLQVMCPRLYGAAARSARAPAWPAVGAWHRCASGPTPTHSSHAAAWRGPSARQSPPPDTPYPGSTSQQLFINPIL